MGAAFVAPAICAERLIPDISADSGEYLPPLKREQQSHLNWAYKNRCERGVRWEFLVATEYVQPVKVHIGEVNAKQNAQPPAFFEISIRSKTAKFAYC
jgi:hypothetical protein